MTEASAKIVLDSISPAGYRLTTFEVVFWRPVLAEVNTHRAFSRNSASSRAIPVKKTLDRIRNDLAYPVIWASEQPGMQGGEEIEQVAMARDIWKQASHQMIKAAEMLVGLGVHKSI